jgi:adenylate cyclase
VAVLFADVVGFTAWSERHGPSEVISLLRDVHARLEEAVFRHEGTLDKFIGDGMLATFGTPAPGPRDASNALACLVSILIEFETWNARRARAGREPIRISLGCHYGPVVVGNIGTDRRLEFAVVGDTVNVASRLEALTRELSCKAAISGALANAVLIEAAGQGSHQLANFVERGVQTLKGRTEKVSVLTYG